MEKTLVKRYDELINTQLFPRPKMSDTWAGQLAFWNEYPPEAPGERFFETVQRVGVEPSGVVNVINWHVDDMTRTVTIWYEILQEGY